MTEDPLEGFNFDVPDYGASGGSTICAICLKDLGGAHRYKNVVCMECDKRAVDESGAPAKPPNCSEWDDIPVFIDGKKCWRHCEWWHYTTILDFPGYKDYFAPF